jgi:hypothetical protein
MVVLTKNQIILTFETDDAKSDYVNLLHTLLSLVQGVHTEGVGELLAETRISVNDTLEYVKKMMPVAGMLKSFAPDENQRMKEVMKTLNAVEKEQAAAAVPEGIAH